MELEPSWPTVISLRSPQTGGSDLFLSHHQIHPEMMGDLHHSLPFSPNLTQDPIQQLIADIDNKPAKPGKMHSGTRLTCEPCRERKVKCNRVFPECNRCARLGYKCTYRDRVSHRASQAAVIQQLQERMNQAEARLAQQGISMTPGTSSPASQHQTNIAAGLPPPPPPSSSSSSAASSIPRTAVHYQQAESPVDMTYNTPTSNMTLGLGRTSAGFGGMSMSMSMAQDTPTLADFDFTTIDNTGFGQGAEQAYGLVGSLDMGLGSPAMDWNHHHMYQRRSTTGEPSSSSSLHLRSVSLVSTDETANTIITSDDLGTLHQIFFDNFAPVMPILHKDRFYQELRASPDDLALKSVSYTISLLAILISEQHRHLERTCYTLARRYIEACETEDESNTFGSIRFFQSLLFLTRYELGRRNCTRASMLLGRAARLGKMLRLDQLDKRGDEPTSPSKGLIGMPYVPLRPTQDAIELEERRRCLWALYIIEGYSTVHTGTLGSLNDEEILVSLPSPGNLDSQFTPANMMPTLPRATTTIQNPEESITPFTGLILVVSLLRKVVQHTLATKTTKDNSRKRLLLSTNYHASPGFWDRHYTLIKECELYGNLLRHFGNLRVLYNDPLAFNIHLTFCAIELRLWDAALDEAEQSGLHNAASENMRHVQECALKIGNAVRSTWGVQRMACDNLSLSGAFVAWPICMAIKGLNRQLSLLHVHEENQPQQHKEEQEQIKRSSSTTGKRLLTTSGQPPLHVQAKTTRTEHEDMEKITMLQMLCAALDEVESPTGPWHESIAGFVR